MGRGPDRRLRRERRGTSADRAGEEAAYAVGQAAAVGQRSGPRARCGGSGDQSGAGGFGIQRARAGPPPGMRAARVAPPSRSATSSSTTSGCATSCAGSCSILIGPPADRLPAATRRDRPRGSARLRGQGGGRRGSSVGPGSERRPQPPRAAHLDEPSGGWASSTGRAGAVVGGTLIGSRAFGHASQQPRISSPVSGWRRLSRPQ